MLRLAGVRDTGRGAKMDAGEAAEMDAWVRANRTAGAVGSVVSAAVRRALWRSNSVLTARARRSSRWRCRPLSRRGSRGCNASSVYYAESGVDLENDTKRLPVTAT
jgi:hypothetical protein